MEVSAHRAPYRAVLGNAMRLVKLQQSNGLRYTQWIEKGTVSHKYGAIQSSIDNTLSFFVFQLS